MGAAASAKKIENDGKSTRGVGSVRSKGKIRSSLRRGRVNDDSKRFANNLSVSYRPGEQLMVFKDPDYHVRVLSDDTRLLLMEATKRLLIIDGCDLREDLMNTILASMKLNVFVKGAVVVKEGDHGSYVFMVENGKLDAYQKGRLTGVYDRGDMFGEATLLHETPYTATVVAKEDARVWRLDRKALKAIQKKLADKKDDSRERFLLAVPEIKALKPEKASELFSKMKVGKYQPGEELYKEGKCSSKIMVIEEGAVEVRLSETAFVKTEKDLLTLAGIFDPNYRDETTVQFMKSAWKSGDNFDGDSKCPPRSSMYSTDSISELDRGSSSISVGSRRSSSLFLSRLGRSFSSKRDLSSTALESRRDLSSIRESRRDLDSIRESRRDLDSIRESRRDLDSTHESKQSFDSLHEHQKNEYGRGCVLGIGVLRSRKPDGSGWRWVDQVVNGVPTVGAVSPVSIIASTNVRVSFFMVAQYENLFGPTSSLYLFPSRDMFDFMTGMSSFSKLVDSISLPTDVTPTALVLPEESKEPKDIAHNLPGGGNPIDKGRNVNTVAPKVPTDEAAVLTDKAFDRIEMISQISLGSIALGFLSSNVTVTRPRTPVNEPVTYSPVVSAAAVPVVQRKEEMLSSGSVGGSLPRGRFIDKKRSSPISADGLDSEDKSTAVCTPVACDASEGSDGNYTRRERTEGKASTSSLSPTHAETGPRAEAGLTSDHVLKGGVFVLKIVSKASACQRKQEARVITEAHFLSSLQHPFIVSLWGKYQTPKDLVLVLERVSGGDLWSLIHEPGDVPKEERSGASTDIAVFPISLVRFYTASIISALEYMHTQKIAHRNLKPENVLIDNRGFIRLVGFGLAKKYPFTDAVTGEQMHRSFTFCGTLEYLSPEIILAIGHDMSVDTWALGILLYELLIGETPFAHIGFSQLASGSHAHVGKVVEGLNEDNESLVMSAIVESKRNGIPWLRELVAEEVRSGADQLLSELLNYDVANRLVLDISSLQQKPFFRSFDWHALRNGAMLPPFVPPACTCDHPRRSGPLQQHDAFDGDDNLFKDF